MVTICFVGERGCGACQDLFGGKKKNGEKESAKHERCGFIQREFYKNREGGGGGR